MRTCDSCQQPNPSDAKFCLRCGEKFLEEAVAPSDSPEANRPEVERRSSFTAVAPPDSPEASTSETTTEEAAPESLTEEQYWQVLIGRSPCLQFAWSSGWLWKPAWEYYQRVFRHFHSAEGPRFALTWNWAPFFIGLFGGTFLWFLYRKMYLFALVYLIGPYISVYLTGDVVVPLVWSIIASASANYVYYWHLKDIFIRVKRAEVHPEDRQRELADAGGVQHYVLWLGAAWVLLQFVLLGVFMSMMADLPPDSNLPLPEEDGAGARQLLP